MTTVARYARTYYRLNVLAWEQIRKLTVPILVIAGAGAAVAWVIGVQTGNMPLMWGATAYIAALSCSYSLSRT